MLDLIAFMAVNDGGELCEELSFILKMVGIVIWGIKVIVPVLLLFFGMLDFVSVVMGKKDDEIKTALNRLKTRAIAAVVVFCVVSIVGLLMNFVGAEDYKACVKCINDPWSCSADIESDLK